MFNTCIINFSQIFVFCTYTRSLAKLSSFFTFRNIPFLQVQSGDETLLLHYNKKYKHHFISEERRTALSCMILRLSEAVQLAQQPLFLPQKRAKKLCLLTTTKG